MTHKYTQREWDRVVGYGKVPEEYEMNSLDIIQNDIYGTADIIKQDTLWLARLRVIADDLNSDEVRQIADRFESLTTTAHNRKHWTGRE